METFSLGPLIARGRTADVYAWEEDQVVKLFHTWCPPHWVEEEIEVSRAVAAIGLPTPGVIDAVEIDGRQGIVYERVDGPSMLTLINERPWLLFRFARQMAELQADMHKLTVDGLPSLRSSLGRTIERVESLAPDRKMAVLQLLDGLPDDNAVCHFDFHPDQILITNDGPVIIDWMTAHHGHPLADVARTSVILTFSQVPYANWLKRTVVDLWRGLFYRTYISRYLELNPGSTMAQVRTWMVPIAAGRLKEEIEGEREPLLAFIESYLAGRS